jgi:hypothetical protein
MLPAVAGIARWLLSDISRGENYVAGLIKDDLCNGLAWSVLTRSAKPPPLEYLCPSWSWASTENQVQFVGLGLSANMRTYEEADLAGPEGFSKISKRVSRNTKLVIDRIELELKGADPYGQVKFASLKLQGRVKVACIDISVQESWCGYPSWNVHPTNSNNKLGVFLADYPPYWISLYQEATTGEVDEVPPEQWRRQIKFLCLNTKEDGTFNALAIKPVEANASPLTLDNKYKQHQRIGFFFYHGRQWPPISQWFEDADWELIELL